MKMTARQRLALDIMDQFGRPDRNNLRAWAEAVDAFLDAEAPPTPDVGDAYVWVAGDMDEPPAQVVVAVGPVPGVGLDRIWVFQRTHPAAGYVEADLEEIMTEAEWKERCDASDHTD